MQLPWTSIFKSTLFTGASAERHLWEMLDELFSLWPHVLACLGILLGAAYVSFVGGGHYAAEASAVALAHLAFRAIGGFFYRHRGTDCNVHRWMQFFSFSAIVSGLAWGSALSILLVVPPAQDAKYLVLTISCVIVQSATARAYMAPLPLLIQTGLMTGLVTCVCIFTGDWIIGPAALLFMSIQLGHMRVLIRLRLRQSRAENEKDRLLGEIARTNENLRNANEELRRVALTDGLTGLPNRRAFDLHLQAYDPLNDPALRPFALILFDVDHFKRFNDTHGHQAGDACLMAIGSCLNALPLPPQQLIARYGGEEFAMILPQTTIAMAAQIAEQLRCMVAAVHVPLDGQTVHVTISLGVAGSDEKPEDSDVSLFAMADHALYQAKQRGRNRAETYHTAARPSTAVAHRLA